jgi:hypothetical protein
MNQAETQFTLNKLDLQLFAEGDAPTAAETAAEPSAEPSAPTATHEDSQEIDYSELGKGNSTDQLDFLKKHGFIGREESQDPPTRPGGQQQSTPDQTNPEETLNGGQPKPEPPQTNDEPEVELKVNGQVKKVKMSEAVNLAQMGFDYTQKTQALAEQQRQLNAIMAAQAQIQPQQPNPQQQVQQEYQAAVAQAERELGLQPGEFNMYDPAHQFVFNRVTMQYNNQQLARQAVQTRLNTFIQRAQQDPLSQQVDAQFDNFIFKMGAEGAEGAQKAQALLIAKQRFVSGNASMQDLDLLEGHWNTVKTVLSTPATPAKPKPVPQQKPNVQPLVTEKPGSSVQPPKARMDYKKLGGMKQSDQLETLKQAGFFKRDKT